MIEQFLLYLKSNRCSENTIKNYRCDLQSIERTTGKGLLNLTVADIDKYMVKMMDRSKATMRRRFFSAKSFFKWAESRGLATSNPFAILKPVKVPFASPRPFTPDECEAFLGVIPEYRIMDKLLFLLLLETGMRITEALTLRISDIDLTQGDEKAIAKVKGGAVRTVHFSHSRRLVDLMTRFIKQCQKKEAFLFSNQADLWQGGFSKGGFSKGGIQKGENEKRRNLHITYVKANRRYSHYLKEAGIQNKTGLHTLRHTAATSMLNHGVDITVVQRMLNHSSVTTTMRYTEVSNNFMKDQLSKMAM